MYRKILSAIFVLIFTVLSSQFGFAAQIRLAWDANTESDLAGYKVYYGNGTRSYTRSIDVGDQTTFALTGLTQGQTYFIVITAYDTSNNESNFSYEISGIASELTPSNEVNHPTIVPPSTEVIQPTIPNSTHVYITTYDQNTEGMPIGNVKQYEVSPIDSISNSTSNIINASNKTNTPGGVQVVDSTKAPAIDATNQIKDTSQSSWSSQPDGKRVDTGGVGEVLASRTKSRNIFTCLGDQNLTAESNAFTIENEKITPELLGLAPEDKVGREKLIQFLHGYDSNTTEKGKLTFVKRKWILGAVVNSRPLVIHYGKSKSVIFVGANDGMLHAFDNTTGEELWGFIPSELLGRLEDLTQDKQLKFYVDGSPKAYITNSQKIILFGLRKGGNHYYALDVSDPSNPKFLWKIGPETTGYSELAQTWSVPQIRKIRSGNGDKVVCIFGGGYGENQSKMTPIAGDQKGKAIYVADILTGTQVWRWDFQKDPNMKYSIPSDISCVDTNGDGYVDRLYVGDTGGRLWRFDINAPDPDTWSGTIVFNSNSRASGAIRKLFYSVDVTLEKGYEMVFFGTGDREHPNGTKEINRIYALKDRALDSVLSEDNLADVTEGMTVVDKSMEKKDGWFISLEAGKGEKVLAPPVVVYGVAYFTTYTPSPDASDGTARIYALSYRNGGPILDLNPENNTGGAKIDLSDRSKIIGKGIPSGTIISAARGRLVALTGVEGGIYNTPLRSHSTIIPIWWREVRK